MYSTLLMGWSQSVFTVGLEFTVEHGGAQFQREGINSEVQYVASLLNDLRLRCLKFNVYIITCMFRHEMMSILGGEDSM